jgi:hypothetical protein
MPDVTPYVPVDIRGFTDKLAAALISTQRMMPSQKVVLDPDRRMGEVKP